MSFRYDVIVVGAGPAGSTAAKLLADAGYHTVLLDKTTFPRHKTCASWINRLVFERFPYLRGHQAELVDSPFAGIALLDQELSRAALWRERRPSGYLSPSPDRRGRTPRSQCTPRDECTIASRFQSRARPCGDECSPPDRHPHRRSPWFRCTALR